MVFFQRSWRNLVLCLLTALVVGQWGCDRISGGGQGIVVSGPGVVSVESEDGADGLTSEEDSQSISDTQGQGVSDADSQGFADEGQYAFFAWDFVKQIDIVLSEGSVNLLYLEPSEYVIGDVIIQGESLDSVGVRLKGKWGSFRTLDEKAAFLLKFNEFTSGQKFAGMRKLALNNMVQDGSMIHEQLAYLLFRDADIPASRTGYAWVRVNGVDYGLYATVEVVDNPHFMSAWFGVEDGTLYEGEYGTDLFWDRIPDFDQDAGEDKSKADLLELVEALDAMEGSADLYEELNQHIDMERFVAFSAIELVLGHWDGYAWTQNNYFIFRQEDSKRWTFMPWGLDQTFWDFLYPFEGQGRIHQMCMTSSTCRQAFGQALQNVVQQFTELQLAQRVAELESLIWPSVMEDPRRPYDIDEVIWSIEQVLVFLESRPLDIEGSLICIDPNNVDDDNDGYSGCGEDCDDGNPDVHPNAPEMCNLVDDDCNGQWDDTVSCPACVPWAAPDGKQYAFCLEQRSWQAALEDCEAQGGSLASMHDEETQLAIVAFFESSLWTNWWIGLNDLDEEGTYLWSDGSAFDYEFWGGGEPNDEGSNEDCVHMAEWSAGRWNDMPCDFEFPYICAGPF